MSRRDLALVAALVGFWAAAAGAVGETAVVLAPAADKPQPGSLYRTAQLSVTNGTAQVAQAVSVRDVRGGVTVLCLATLPPGASATLVLSVPATSTRQSYRVRLLASPEADATVLFEARQELTWPGDVVEATMAALVDPQAYDRLAPLAPAWPAEVRRNVLVLAALGALLLVATMFLPRQSLRLSALLVLTVAACLAAGAALNNLDLLLVHEAGPITAVAARRTTTWTISRAGRVPLYAVKSQLTADTTILGPDDMLQTTIHPDAMRLFVYPPPP